MTDAEVALSARLAVLRDAVCWLMASEAKRSRNAEKFFRGWSGLVDLKIHAASEGGALLPQTIAVQETMKKEVDSVVAIARSLMKTKKG